MTRAQLWSKVTRLSQLRILWDTLLTGQYPPTAVPCIHHIPGTEGRLHGDVADPGQTARSVEGLVPPPPAAAAPRGRSMCLIRKEKTSGGARIDRTFFFDTNAERKKNEPSRDIFTQDEAILSGFYHHLLLLQQSKFKLYMKHKNS